MRIQISADPHLFNFKSLDSYASVKIALKFWENEYQNGSHKMAAGSDPLPWFTHEKKMFSEGDSIISTEAGVATL